MCTETCVYASDGWCDDGGPGAEYSACSVGTDCTDCGPRMLPTPPSPPPPSPSPPPPSPPPPPPPLNTYFTITYGSCTVEPSSPNCIRSPNFPLSYGNSEACSITPTALALGRPLTATSFITESCCDYLRIPSHPSGTLTSFNSGIGGGPSNFILGPGTIQWTTDSSVTNTGWRVCICTASQCAAAQPQPSPPPPPPPTGIIIIIIGAVVGGIAVIAVCIGVAIVLRRKRSRRPNQRRGEQDPALGIDIESMAAVERAAADKAAAERVVANKAAAKKTAAKKTAAKTTAANKNAAAEKAAARLHAIFPEISEETLTAVLFQCVYDEDAAVSVLLSMNEAPVPPSSAPPASKPAPKKAAADKKAMADKKVVVEKKAAAEKAAAENKAAAEKAAAEKKAAAERAAAEKKAAAEKAVAEKKAAADKAAADKKAAAEKAAAEKAAAERAAAEKAAEEKAAAERAAAERLAVERAAAERAEDKVSHWRMELDKMANARAELCKAQDRVRLLAAVAANEDESLREATKVRNEARVAFVRVLEDALSAHDEGEKERRSLTAEAAALQQQQQQQGECALTLAEQVWLMGSDGL